MSSNRPGVQHTITKTARWSLITSILACFVLIAYLALSAALPASPTDTVQSDPGKLPLAFIPNQGQAQPEVLFQASDLNAAFFLTATDIVFAKSETAQNEQSSVRIHHENAQEDVVANGANTLKGTVNYIQGQNPARWLTHLPTYATVMFSGLYPGIDLQYDGKHGAFESTYYVKPGADPALIRWSHSGNVLARLNAETGSIEMYDAQAKTGKPMLVEQAPIVYQEIDGQQAIIPSHFTQNKDGSFSYAISAYDPTKTLVIDPTLVYSSYAGGGQLDSTNGIALDSSGNMYITGMTVDTSQAASAGEDDIFVIKLNPSGSEMLYSTYLGGSGDDEANGLSVDPDGSLYLAGDTTSRDFPLKNAYASACEPMFDICVADAFLTRLSADGSQVLYSTYLGGQDPDMAMGVVAGSTGHAYLVGQTFSTDFPTRLAVQTNPGGEADAFVAHINTNAVGDASLVWSTYLGGSGDDMGAAIGLAGAQLVVTGETTSNNFPTDNAIQNSNQGKQDVFITGMTDGGAIRYSTYLGGSDEDTAYGIAVNDQGAYLTGTTLSTNLPILTPIQPTKHSGHDAFVTGINADGGDWMFSTYMGGNGADYGYGIAVDDTGAIYITGSTFSTDFPLLNTFQAYKGNGDAFVAKIKPAFNDLAYSTLLGGSETETGVGIAVDNQANSYVAGTTFSTNYPLKDALVSQYAGHGDVFVSIINDEGTNPPPLDTPVIDPVFKAPTLQSINPLNGSLKAATAFVLAPGETVTFAIVMHNSTMEPVTATVVDKLPVGLDYTVGTASPQATYNPTERTLTWTNVAVPGKNEVELTYDCTTTVTEPKTVTNTASITSASGTITRSLDMKIGPHDNIDGVRPVVDDFTIEDKDILTSRNVTLHIQAHDDEAVEKMYIREFYVEPSPLPHWQAGKSSGWVDYAETYDWQLGNQSGVHYLAMVVADNAHNISIFNENAVDFASLLLPNTQLGPNGLIPYLVYYPKDTSVQASLIPTKGNPRLYVWYPGNVLKPDKSDDNTQVEFVTPRDGIYYFLVTTATDTTYTLEITPVVNNSLMKAMAKSAAPERGGQDTELLSDPLLSKIGFDPFGSRTGLLPTSYSVTYMPMLRH